MPTDNTTNGFISHCIDCDTDKRDDEMKNNISCKACYNERQRSNRRWKRDRRLFQLKINDPVQHEAEISRITRRAYRIPHGKEQDAARIRQNYARSRMFGIESSLTLDDLDSIRDAQTNSRGLLICWGCGKPIKGTPHLDHWIPLALGGTNDPGNLHYMHAKCNLEKGAKMPTEIGRLV